MTYYYTMGLSESHQGQNDSPTPNKEKTNRRAVRWFFLRVLLEKIIQELLEKIKQAFSSTKDHREYPFAWGSETRASNSIRSENLCSSDRWRKKVPRRNRVNRVVNYSDVQNRSHSYQHWQTESICNHVKLAEAGFFYNGYTMGTFYPHQGQNDSPTPVKENSKDRIIKPKDCALFGRGLRFYEADCALFGRELINEMIRLNVICKCEYTPMEKKRRKCEKSETGKHRQNSNGKLEETEQEDSVMKNGKSYTNMNEKDREYSMKSMEGEENGNFKEKKTSNKNMNMEEEGLEYQRICKICLDTDLCMIFFPCRHLVACEACSDKLTNCAVCRSGIRGSVKVNFK